jgi:hypothetical protein
LGESCDEGVLVKDKLKEQKEQHDVDRKEYRKVRKKIEEVINDEWKVGYVNASRLMFIGDVRRSWEAEIGKKVKEERMMKLEMERKKIEEEALVARIEGKKEYGRGRDRKKREEDRRKERKNKEKEKVRKVTEEIDGVERLKAKEMDELKEEGKWQKSKGKME